MNAPKFTPDDRSMFQRFHISLPLVKSAGIRRVTDAEARKLGIRGRSTQNMAGLVFPYYDCGAGKIMTLRVRRDLPEMKNGKPDGKYMCPKGGPRILYIHPRSVPKLKNTSVPIVLVEAEKSALALLALSERTQTEILPIAMGGCWGWSQDKKAIPALLQMCIGHFVYVLLDSNVTTNENVKEARDALVAELRTPAYACPEVLVAEIPRMEGVNGPDDLLALDNGDDLLLNVLEAATPAVLGAYSDDALALSFTEMYERDLRYVDGWGRWYVWDGSCWRRDDTLSVYDKARKVCRDAADRCGKKQIAQRVRSAQTVAAVERLTRADRKHAATNEQWDADPWLLNTPGGVVDLRTGAMRPAAREDYCTKITAVAPSGECRLWPKFLADVTGGDKKLQAYLQRVCGYILTGVTYEHALFFLYGTGANGKSVFINTLSGVLHDYARVAPIETFIASTNEHHPTDLAGLQGAHLVTSTETEDGRRWNEPKLKAVTGGDKISARLMRQDFFEFTPQFKLLISGNHQPGLRTVDEAMRRRMNLVPFNVTIPPVKRDLKLAEKLRKEWGGILQWAIEGCLAWQSDGLRPPQAVSAATADYMTAEDAMGHWLEDRTIKDVNAKTSPTELYQDWRCWAATAGEFVGALKRFSQRLSDRGYKSVKSNGSRYFKGIRLASQGREGASKPNIPVRENSYEKFSNGDNRGVRPSPPLSPSGRPYKYTH